MLAPEDTPGYAGRLLRDLSAQARAARVAVVGECGHRVDVLTREPVPADTTDLDKVEQAIGELARDLAAAGIADVEVPARTRRAGGWHYVCRRCRRSWPVSMPRIAAAYRAALADGSATITLPLARG